MEHRTLESLKVEAQILAAVLDKVHLTWQPWPEHQEKAITRVRALLNTANDAIEERTLWPYKVTYVAFGYRYSLRCGNWRAARETLDKCTNDTTSLWPFISVCCPIHGWRAPMNEDSDVGGVCVVCGYNPDADYVDCMYHGKQMSTKQGFCYICESEYENSRRHLLPDSYFK